LNKNHLTDRHLVNQAGTYPSKNTGLHVSTKQCAN
jgi:hypothetical protein